MLPDVKVNILNGALGSVADSPDGVAAMVMSGVTATGLALATPAVIYSLAEAEGLGITATGDNAAAYRHIKEFYQGYQAVTGSEVAELYIMLLAKTVTLTQMADTTLTVSAAKLLDYAQGRVRRIGFARTPDVDYTPVLTDGIDADCLTALPKAHALTVTYRGKQTPLRALVEARGFLAANVAATKDLHTYAYNGVGLVMYSSLSDGSSSVGMQLGLMSGLPVHRKVSRVRNGALPLTDVYIGNTRAELLTSIGTLHDKGYQIARVFPGYSGYYANYDYMCAPLTDDYCTMTNGCVIDKAHRITYNTYVQELSDDVEVNATNGQLTPGYIAFLRHQIVDNVTKQMAGEISGFDATIDPSQNTIATGKLTIKEKVTPVGYNKDIVVDLGLDNPANS